MRRSTKAVRTRSPLVGQGETGSARARGSAGVSRWCLSVWQGGAAKSCAGCRRETPLLHTALPSLAQVISSTPLFHQPGPHPQSSFVFFPILRHRMLLASPRYRCRRRPRLAFALSSAAAYNTASGYQ